MRKLAANFAQASLEPELTPKKFPSSPQMGELHIRRNTLFLEHVGGVLGIRVDVEEPQHLVNPLSAQDIRTDLSKRSSIVSKARAPSMEATKHDRALGARLVQVAVVFAAFRITRFRPLSAEDVEA